jgi:cytochrome c553
VHKAPRKPRKEKEVTRIALFAAALALLSGCPSEKPAYPDPRPAAPEARPAQPGAPAPAPGAPAAAPGAPAAPAAAVAITPEAQAEADQTFATLCATCHGPDGEGNGPAAAAFPVKPRNFKDPEWQKSVTDEHIDKVILQGGPAVGKSPLMPPNPQFAEKPGVILALRNKVRGLGPK